VYDLKLEWQQIDWVLLDMDGTLLDLHFDNYFWLNYLPEQYAKENNMSHQSAITHLTQEFDAQRGKLEWYCLDYWTSKLNMPIAELKEDIKHKIALRDECPEFLSLLKQRGKRLTLLTNAHPDSLSLKLRCTGIDQWFDDIISTHDIGFAKESQKCWQQLEQQLCFDKSRTLFIDDSESVLSSAQQFGIQYCYGIQHPDSTLDGKQTSEFPLIDKFMQLF